MMHPPSLSTPTPSSSPSDRRFRRCPPPPRPMQDLGVHCQRQRRGPTPYLPRPSSLPSSAPTKPAPAAPSAPSTATATVTPERTRHPRPRFRPPVGSSASGDGPSDCGSSATSPSLRPRFVGPPSFGPSTPGAEPAFGSSAMDSPLDAFARASAEADPSVPGSKRSAEEQGGPSVSSSGAMELDAMRASMATFSMETNLTSSNKAAYPSMHDDDDSMDDNSTGNNGKQATKRRRRASLLDEISPMAGVGGTGVGGTSRYARRGSQVGLGLQRSSFPRAA